MNALLKNLDHWTKYSCGNKCRSYNPCVNLKVTIDESDEVYNLKENQDASNKPCTFFRKKCMDNSNLNFDSRIQYANNSYNQYINKTISCYYDDDKDFVFIEINFIVHYIILAVVCIGFIICCIIESCMIYGKYSK